MMASLSLSTLPITATTKKPNTCSRSPLFSKPSPRRFKVSCNGAGDDDHKPSETTKLILPKTSLDMQNVDRRNLLLGLGGIYGATNLASVQSALAFPVTAPDDIRKCTAVHVKDPLRSVQCCPTPPVTYHKPKNYDLPHFQKTRVRPAAQTVTSEYIKKYELAIKRMKHLDHVDPSDPHSWNQQAKIHCAYCCKAYIQGNNIGSSYRINVHQSSLFFPFHRWYLYFHERILGKLLGDETFALPYWNWDNPPGMMIPAMYTRRNSPLFDQFRNANHLPPTIVDLNYCEERHIEPHHLIKQNLCTMRRQMIDNAHSAENFFGLPPWPSPPNPNPNPNEPLSLPIGKYDSPGAGSIENPVHNAVHRWTGDPCKHNDEDMGTFYSAGYDPIFYAHHANVDRMWTIWKRDQKHKEPKYDDWLNASYVFYDENKELVRVYNKDCVNTIQMGYEFEESPTPWKDIRSVPRHKKKKNLDYVKRVEDMEFPVKLDRVVKVYVKRPVKKRINEEKENAKEMLFLNGIKYDSSVYLKFDVWVNAFDDEIETNACDSEFAGSFAEVAQYHGEKFKTSRAVFGITRLLEEVKAEDDDHVLVSLVPRGGADEVTISEIKIELVPVDD